MKPWIGLVLALLFALGGSPLRSEPLRDHLPSDALAFVEIDPTPLAAKTDRKGEGEFFDLGVQAMSSLGVMPREAAAVTNLLRLAGQLGQRHNVLAWIDADFIVNYDTGRLTTQSGQFIWIVDVDGQPDPFLALLSAVLSDYSTPQTAHSASPPAAKPATWIFTTRAGRRGFIFTGCRKGATWCWASAAARWSITLIRAPNPARGMRTISAVDRALTRQGATGSPVLRAWCSPDQMRTRWPDVMTMTIASRLLQAFDLRDTDQDLLTGSLREREFLVHNATVAKDALAIVPWTAELPAAAPLRQLVPAEASFYAIFNVDWNAVYDLVVNVVDVAAENHKDEGLQSAVEQFEQLYGVNVRKDIAEGLSPLVLIDDAPRHPLRLPGMVTLIAAAKPDRRQQVRSAVDKLIALAARVLDGRAGAADAGAPAPAIKRRNQASGRT